MPCACNKTASLAALAAEKKSGIRLFIVPTPEGHYAFCTAGEARTYKNVFAYETYYSKVVEGKQTSDGIWLVSEEQMGDIVLYETTTCVVVGE